MDFEECRNLRTPSKFETTGKWIEKKLLEAKETGDTRVYPHQIEAVFGVKAKLAENVKKNCSDPVLVVAPTGSGKTGMITLLAYILQCCKVLILTPSRIISKQLAESFGIFDNYPTFFEKIGLCPRDSREQLMEHGQILARGSDVSLSVPNLVIVTAQTFAGDRLSILSRKKSDNPQLDDEFVDNVKTFFEKFDILIVDEAHHYPAETWSNIENKFRASGGSTKHLIFFTATPKRKFKGKLIDVLPSQRIAYSIKREALEGKYIRPLGFRQGENERNLLSDIKTILEDSKVLDPRFCKPQECRMPQAMILVNKREEADNLAKKLNESAKNPNFAVSIHGGDKAEARRKTNEFKNGKKYQVAITCGLLLEGFDNAAVTLCVILRHLDSNVLFSQFIGRCMRLMKFSDGPTDKTIGTVLSYPEYNQRKMFEKRDSIAEVDPVETQMEDEGDDDDNNQQDTRQPTPHRVPKRSQSNAQDGEKRFKRP